MVICLRTLLFSWWYWGDYCKQTAASPHWPILQYCPPLCHSFPPFRIFLNEFARVETCVTAVDDLQTAWSTAGTGRS